jgi:3-hydroxymyristoyl/3-hydroxydecanoyl-(acyl carrier protein) dehydratase
LVPGVILIESMAQTLAYWAAFKRPDLRLLLAGVEDCKFRRAVQPGQTVRFSVQLERVVLSKAVVGLGVAHVGRVKVAKARLTGFALPGSSLQTATESPSAEQ